MAQANCPHCGGTGWKVVEGAGGRVAARCECTATDRETRVLERARVPRRYEHCVFENFDTGLAYDGEPADRPWNRSLEQAKLVAQAFAHDYPVGVEHGLLLMGPAGVGKTHLAVAALKEIALRGHDGLFYDYNELLKEIQHSYNRESQSSEMDVLEPVLAAGLLVLDDLGASKPSAWALETVGHILNTRYNEKRVTLITTNFPDEAPPPNARASKGSPAGSYAGEVLADRIGHRIRSRLYEMCRTVEMFAPDYRKELRQAGHLRT